MSTDSQGPPGSPDPVCGCWKRGRLVLVHSVKAALKSAAGPRRTRSELLSSRLQAELRCLDRSPPLEPQPGRSGARCIGCECRCHRFVETAVQAHAGSRSLKGAGVSSNSRSDRQGLRRDQMVTLSGTGCGKQIPKSKPGFHRLRIGTSQKHPILFAVLGASRFGPGAFVLKAMVSTWRPHSLRYGSLRA